MKVNPLHIFRGSTDNTTRIVLAALAARAPKPLSSKELLDAVCADPEQRQTGTIRSLRHLKLVLNQLKKEKVVTKQLVAVPLEEMSETEHLRMYREAVPRAWRWSLPGTEPKG